MPQTATENQRRVQCSRCHTFKPLSEFYRNSETATGFSPFCKACDLAAQRLLGVKVSETRTFGVEIECYCRKSREDVARALRAAGLNASANPYSHTDKDYWEVTTDASVPSHHDNNSYEPADYWHGMEIVSPCGPAALKGKRGLRELRKVTRVLARLGVKVDKRCGLHTHQYARDLDLIAFKNLAKLYVKHEAAFDSIVPASRRGERAASGPCGVMAHGLMEASYFTARDYIYSTDSYEPMTKATVFAHIDTCYDVDAIARLWTDRYLKLNYRSFAVHGTVEFRHFGGTVDFEKMVYWVALTQSMVEQAATMTIGTRGAVSLAAVFTAAHTQPTVRRFFEARAARLAS
jgi:hypothetical protein